ncbi:oxidoreductase [Hafnia alvei]|uniref:terminase large subunit domain-containing protein n=1 Tax=Hafnia alvei TaxID=569 RepID=UPI0018DE50E8|nr:terminase family protein [Hafnia alvei]MBI0277281.1 oxidoreductase [Hafnia alvei]
MAQIIHMTDPRDEAKSLYWQAYSVPQIASRLGVSCNTLYSWRRRDAWDATTPMQRAYERTDVQYIRLVEKSDPTPGDLKRIDLLARQLDRFERTQQRGDSERKRKRAPKNHFTDEQIAQVEACVIDSLYAHQARWFSQWDERNRFILKSRQIGATWYFAREALLRALKTGNNQIFLSASRAQALQFKKFIKELAALVGVELKGGEQIELSNGATLYFLGTSAATAQSYTGDLYMDEAFWISNFINLRAVAAGMASQIGLRRTYFSTPSSEDHEAYPFWTGDRFNESRPKSSRVDIDVRHKALKRGKRCADGIWRQIVTIKDAIASGFDLISQAQVEAENSPADFSMLYMCEFIKSGERAFDYNQLLACGVDGYDVWDDWKPEAMRPMGRRAVWVGYDPNGGDGNGDSAGLVVVVPPAVPGGKFRVIERIQLRGMTFEAQADAIKALTARYNVQHVAIDGTGGYGDAVHQLVIKFFPAAVKYQYSVSLKRMMVLKALMLIRAGRLEYDSGMMDLVRAFMTISKKVTDGGIVTYESARTRGNNHGDLAWATLHVLYNEPISSDSGGSDGASVMEF